MKIFSLGSLPALAAAIATALVAGCVSTASDGRYQTNPRGGWDNFLQHDRGFALQSHGDHGFFW